MDYRKLISFGKGGYVISVPKDWVEENKLKKGSFIAFQRDGSTLRLSTQPEQSSLNAEKEMIIDVDGVPMPTLYRRLRSAYLNSYTNIILRGEELKDKREELKKRIDKLIALEIFESSKNRLVLRDLMNFNNIDFFKDFRKMDITIRSIIIDLKKFDPSLFESIESRDDEIDRLFFLLLKALKMGMQNSHVLKKFGISLSKSMIYWVYIYSLENYGDELIALLQACKKCSFNKEAKKDFLDVYNEMEKLYLETMRIIHLDDFKSSFSLAEEHKVVLKKIFELVKRYPSNTLLLTALNHMGNLVNLTYFMLRNYYY